MKITNIKKKQMSTNNEIKIKELWDSVWSLLNTSLSYNLTGGGFTGGLDVYMSVNKFVLHTQHLEYDY